MLRSHSNPTASPSAMRLVAEGYKPLNATAVPAGGFVQLASRDGRVRLDFR